MLRIRRGRVLAQRECLHPHTPQRRTVRRRRTRSSRSGARASCRGSRSTTSSASALRGIQYTCTSTLPQTSAWARSRASTEPHQSESPPPTRHPVVCCVSRARASAKAQSRTPHCVCNSHLPKRAPAAAHATLKKGEKYTAVAHEAHRWHVARPLCTCLSSQDAIEKERCSQLRLGPTPTAVLLKSSAVVSYAGD